MELRLIRHILVNFGSCQQQCLQVPGRGLYGVRVDGVYAIALRSLLLGRALNWQLSLMTGDWSWLWSWPPLASGGHGSCKGLIQSGALFPGEWALVWAQLHTLQNVLLFGTCAGCFYGAWRLVYVWDTRCRRLSEQ